MPAKSSPSSRRWSRVSANPAQPWSITWLLANETILMPLAFSASGSANGASNMNGFDPLRVRRRHRRLQVHKAEVGLLEDIGSHR